MSRKISKGGSASHLGMHQNEIIKLFRSFDKSRRIWEIFCDFLLLAGYSIANAPEKAIFGETELYLNREERYLATIRKYNKEDQMRFPEILSHLTLALEDREDDILGEIYMNLELGNDDRGQYFTPIEIPEMMAEMVVGIDEEAIRKNGFMSVSDPCIGGGAMAIGLLRVLKRRGYNYQEQLFFHGIDIDLNACMMSYIQLSLLGVPAEIVHGDSLSLKFQNIFRTPMFYLGQWPIRLKNERLKEKIMKLFKSGNPEDSQPIEEVINLQEEVQQPSIQMSLF